MALNWWQFTPPGNLQNPLVGPAIASAATIAPTYMIHHITGAAAIVNITVPDAQFNGPIILIADGIFTWTAAGNIAVAGTSTAVGRVIILVYDPVTTKWYPSATA